MAQKHYISCIEHPMTVATTEQGPHKRYRRLRFPSFDADVWANKNPLLQKGELGHEKDTGRFKVGDGVTYWLDLPYNSVGDPAKVNGHNVLEIIAGKNVEIEQSGNVLIIGASGAGYTKQEVDDKFTVANAQIDANAVAIAKTRDDYMSADTDIMKIINNHAEELTTLHNDIDELGDDVADIQAKIPESASGTNPLITKQQLLDEEMDIRDDVNEMVGELQTQITAQAAAIATLDSEKLDKNQGDINAGKYLVVGNDGNIELTTSGGGGSGGISSVAHDETLSGAGTDASPLGVAKNLSVEELTVGTDEGTLNLSITAGVATIATNNGLDIVSQTKFDKAPTTDDNTTWTDALDTSLVRKAQVASAMAGSSYTAGTGIDITNGTISVTAPTLQNKINSSDQLILLSDRTTIGTQSILIGAYSYNVNGSYTVAIGDHCGANGSYAVAIGSGARSEKSSTVSIGASSNTNFGTVTQGFASTAIGANTKTDGDYSIALGYKAQSTAENAIQIGSVGTTATTNSDANTFKVGNANGNFELMSADGTIPADRIGNLDFGTMD